MRKLIIIALCLIATNAYSQDWKKELSKQLVEIKGEKMIANDLTLITMVADGTSMQVKSYAEAPANDFISRDQFVAFFATGSYAFTTQMLTEAGLTENDYKSKTVDVADLIGTADVELFFYMNKNGVQIVIKAGGEEEKITQTWESILN